MVARLRCVEILNFDLPPLSHTKEAPLRANVLETMTVLEYVRIPLDSQVFQAHVSNYTLLGRKNAKNSVLVLEH